MITETSGAAFRRNLGEMFNIVRYRDDSVLIKKDGKPVAALIDDRLFERIRRMQERFDAQCDRLEQTYTGVPEKEALAEIERARARAWTAPKISCKCQWFALRCGIAPFMFRCPIKMLAIRRSAAIAFATSVLLGSAMAGEPEYLLVIKGHRFEPSELRVPAGQRVKLLVHNQDATPEEFESHALNREKLVPAGAKAAIYVGPLKPGRYTFYGEYNEATAKGTVIAE